MIINVYKGLTLLTDKLDGTQLAAAARQILPADAPKGTNQHRTECSIAVPKSAVQCQAVRGHTILSLDHFAFLPAPEKAALTSSLRSTDFKNYQAADLVVVQSLSRVIKARQASSEKSPSSLDIKATKLP